VSAKANDRSRTTPEVSAKENVDEHKEARASLALLENEAGGTGQHAPFAQSMASNLNRPSHSSRRSPSAGSRTKRFKHDSSAESAPVGYDQYSNEDQRDSPQDLRSVLENDRSDKREALELHMKLRLKLIHLFKKTAATVKNEKGEGSPRSLVLSNLKEIDESNKELEVCEKRLLEFEERCKSSEEQLSQIFDSKITLNRFKKLVMDLKASVNRYDVLVKKKVEIEGEVRLLHRLKKDSSRMETRAEDIARNISQMEIEIRTDREHIDWYRYQLEPEQVDPDQVWEVQVSEVYKQVPPLLPFEVENQSREASGAVS
jgi:hypothetical protein